MKRVIKFALCIALALTCAFALVACSSSRSGGGMSRAEISETYISQAE